MNNFVISEVNDFEKKLSGYTYLLNFRYMNLCVKANPVALLPVSVLVADEEKEMEDVANVAQTDDFHLAVIPRQTELLKNISQGVLGVHPEFKMEVMKLDENDPKSDYLLFEMPVVDKDRRDFLNEAVKSLHKECKIRLDELKVEEKEGFGELFLSYPEDLKEANDAIDKKYREAVDNIDELLEKKQKEIEEGYQHYLDSQAEELQANAGIDVTSSMRLSDE
jgi:ribosome recycling factor